MQAYTALYKSDAIAPESPFSRSSSMTAMQTFSSFSSQGSRRLSPTNPMRSSRALASSLSSPNLKVTPLSPGLSYPKGLNECYTNY